MKKVMTIIGAFAMTLGGCASVNDLPAPEEAFAPQSGWAKEAATQFYSRNKRSVWDAAIKSSNKYGMKVSEENYEKGVIYLSGGISWTRWNAVAAIFIRKAKDGRFGVRYVVQESKEVGIAGDIYAGSYAKDFFDSMDYYLGVHF